MVRTVFSKQVYYFSNQERIMKHSSSNTLVYTFASLTVEHYVIFLEHELWREVRQDRQEPGLYHLLQGLLPPHY